MGEAGTRELGVDTSRPTRHLVALALLIMLGALLFASERTRGITIDEPLHLVRGHTLWWTGETNLSYAHPPLANLITASPYAGRGDRKWGHPLDVHGEKKSKTKKRSKKQRRRDRRQAKKTREEIFDNSKNRIHGRALMLANGYFIHDYGTAKAELRGARRVMMVITVLFGLGLYFWVERRWGWTAAVISLGLFSLHPTIVAHGRLVTTDMPLALTACASLATLIAWIERPGWGRAAWFCLATTLMVLTKHTGLPLVVLMSLVLIGAATFRVGGFRPPADAEPDKNFAHLASLGLVVLQLTLVAAVMILAIDAIYLFDRVGLSVEEILDEPEMRNWLSDEMDHTLLDHGPLAGLPGHWRLPFPYSWLAGLSTVARQNEIGHGNFFFGVNDEPGHPLYFPVMLLAKSPLGILALVLAGVLVLVGRWRDGHKPSVATTVIVVIATLVMLSACRSRINIGVRHILVLMPLMAVLGGRAAQLVIEGARDRRERRVGQAFVLASLLTCIGGAAWTFPHYLGDFNLIVGGPEGGHEISIIGEDWGQDMFDLANYLEAEGHSSVAYYGRVAIRNAQLLEHNLEIVKMPCTRPPKVRDIPMAIHIGNWERRPECFRWLRILEIEPAAVINHHILVFDPVPPSKPRKRRAKTNDR